MAEESQEQLPDQAEQNGASEESADDEGYGLSDLELGILSIEKRRWRYQGSKEQAINRELGIKATRYYQVLNALIDDPRLLAYDPHLTRRLQARRQV